MPETVSKVIPVFFACDENFVKYMMVTIRSLMNNAVKGNEYRIHVLNTGISEERQKLVVDLVSEREDFNVDFPDVSAHLESIRDRLPLRDYYSMTTYYRLFIPDMYPEYDKVIYLDSDVVVLGNIADFYSYDIGDNMVGAIRDQLVQQLEVFGEYVEQVLGVDRNSYFNAGVLLMNTDRFRRSDFLDRFLELLNTYTFVVAQDQDYLNVICKNKVHWIPIVWNLEASSDFDLEADEIRLIHFNMAAKPWNYQDCVLGDYFWKYAKLTSVYEEICAVRENYTEESMENDIDTSEQLLEICREEILREDNYKKTVGDNPEKAQDRLDVLKKIAALEKEGRFDQDVEDDPPSRQIQPGEVDYLRRKYRNKIKTRLSYQIARVFVNYMIEKRFLIIKEIRGIENFNALDSGAIITCNHFNPFDSFAAQMAYEASKHGHRKLYRIIKEGNYTSFPGFYGVLMRNCNTLPLSSNVQTMKDFMKAVDKVLQKGHYILIYPEQSLWWNYKKPKPLKRGAFDFAARNHVPVLPIFITMEDSDKMGPDGFYVQEYTINIGKPIYPDPEKKTRDNSFAMLEENYRVWKEIYEDFYGIPLTYSCEEPVGALGKGKGIYEE